MYAKLIDGALQTAPKKLTGDGVIVYNPPAEMYLAVGYKPVTFVDPPEAPEDFYYESGWEEQTDAIVQTWTLTPLPEDIDEAEAYDIIFGGAK
jgi:hypothetical protein